ncbi:MAG: TetR family transcriptional regulator [Streptosporangiales bacterium]|nr:TetR family transcriptional regulator [Streptosporangiales bacterium]
MTRADTKTTRGRGRPRDPGTDVAILKAALELFADRGIDATSLEGIARRAGVARLTLYRRWNSKEELIAQAIESALASIPRPAEDDARDGDPVSDLVERSIPASAAVLADPLFSGMVAQILGSAVRYPLLMEIYWERYVLPRRRATAVLLDRAKAEGLLAADADVDVLTDMMAGAVLYRAVRPGALDEAKARAYLEAVYREAGLLPREAGQAGSSVRGDFGLSRGTS